MIRKILFFVLFFSVSFFCFSEVVINVSSEPQLPLENLIKNSGFENDSITPWVITAADKEFVSLDTSITSTGSKSVKIVSDPDKRPKIYQRIKFEPALPAGTELYFRVSAKKENAGEGRPASLAIHLRYDDGSSSYVPVPALPDDDYDWLTVERVVKLSKNAISGTVYLCHYNQEGEQWFDDIVLLAGRTQLSLEVKSKVNLANVRLRSNQEALLYDSKKLPANSKDFTKVFDLPAYADYYVEVVDSNGKKWEKVFPENAEKNLLVSENILPLTSFNRLVLRPNTPEVFNLELAALAGKKAILNLSARLANDKLAGYTGALKILVNGKLLGADELLKPKDLMVTSQGRETRFSTNRGYVTFYSPAYFGISVESVYCPVSEDDRNPFNYRLDITKLLKAGNNEISISSSASSPKREVLMIVEKARIELE